MLLLVSGWPACGKTFLGAWLEENRGFRHFDVGEPAPKAVEAHSLWEEHMPDGAASFVAALRALHPRWVITWGAPANCMPFFDGLRSAGFDTWFLLAEREQTSRQLWLQREREANREAKPREWESKAGEIRKGARELRRFFRGRCLVSITSRGERVPCSVLAKSMGVPVRNGQ